MYAEVELILDLSAMLMAAFVGGLMAKCMLQFYNNKSPKLIEDTN